MCASERARTHITLEMVAKDFRTKEKPQMCSHENEILRFYLLYIVHAQNSTQQTIKLNACHFSYLEMICAC